VHARKAWLSGLSPKENRTVPPLHYDRVHRLKADFPEYTFLLNGGIETLEEAFEHRNNLDGVMLGRAAYHTPALLLDVDKLFFNATGNKTMDAVVSTMGSYVDGQQDLGVPLHRLTKPLIGAFQGRMGAKSWRRAMTTEAQTFSAKGSELIHRALEQLEPKRSAA